MSDTTDPLANLLAAAKDARVRFWPEDGKIHHRAPESLSAAMKAAVLANKPELLDVLAKWDEAEAWRLVYEADDLVCELEVSGLDAEIQRAAALCVWGQHCQVMPAVRRGCALVEERARKLVDATRRAA